MRLNKTIVNQVVNDIIRAHHKKKYDNAMTVCSEAATKLQIEKSRHADIIALKLEPELLCYVSATSAINLNSCIYCETVDFIPGRKTTIVLTHNVYAYEHYYLNDEHLPELVELRKVVKKIEAERKKLFDVVSTYRDTKNLVADFPWIEEYLPVRPVSGTAVIALDTINSINDAYGG